MNHVGLSVQKRLENRLKSFNKGLESGQRTAAAEKQKLKNLAKKNFNEGFLKVRA